ncbi:MAG: Peroxiredoxin 1, variant 2 [Marteilia pararefringens]
MILGSGSSLSRTTIIASFFTKSSPLSASAKHLVASSTQNSSIARRFFHQEKSPAPRHDPYINLRQSSSSSSSSFNHQFGNNNNQTSPQSSSSSYPQSSSPSPSSPQMPRLNKRLPIINCEMVSAETLQNEPFITTEFQSKSRWSLLLFLPGCFSQVCTTDILRFSEAYDEFKALGCQIVAVSVAHPDAVAKWMSTSVEKGGIEGSRISVICDKSHRMCKYCNVFNYSSSSPFRSTIIINQEGFLKHYSSNLATIGRCVKSTLRNVAALDHLNNNEAHCLPSNWQIGDQGIENSRLAN